MALNRRALVLAAGALPLQAAALAAAAQEGSPLGRRSPEASPTLAIEPAPQLPDKANFPAVANTTYVDSAGSHPWSAGSIALIKGAAVHEASDQGGFIPNEARIKANFAKLINADADEIAFVPSTSIGESFVAAALGLCEHRHGLRDADDDGARQPARRVGRTQSGSQAAVLDHVRGRREGAGVVSRAVRRRAVRFRDS